MYILRVENLALLMHGTDLKKEPEAQNINYKMVVNYKSYELW